MDLHLDASSAEPGELILHAVESGIVGTGGDRYLEPSTRARPQRIFANRLRRLRRELAPAPQFARPFVPSRRDACPDECPLCIHLDLLRSAAHARESALSTSVRSSSRSRGFSRIAKAPSSRASARIASSPNAVIRMTGVAHCALRSAASRSRPVRNGMLTSDRKSVV